MCLTCFRVCDFSYSCKPILPVPPMLWMMKTIIAFAVSNNLLSSCTCTLLYQPTHYRITHHLRIQWLNEWAAKQHGIFLDGVTKDASRHSWSQPTVHDAFRKLWFHTRFQRLHQTNLMAMYFPYRLSMQCQLYFQHFADFKLNEKGDQIHTIDFYKVMVTVCMGACQSHGHQQYVFRPVHDL